MQQSLFVISQTILKKCKCVLAIHKPIAHKQQLKRAKAQWHSVTYSMGAQFVPSSNTTQLQLP